LHAVFALEAFNASGGIDQALLSGVERMAIRAHFDTDFRQGGTRFEGVAARASNQAAAVLGMDFSFHLPFLPLARSSEGEGQGEGSGQPICFVFKNNIA